MGYNATMEDRSKLFIVTTYLLAITFLVLAIIMEQ